MSLESFEFDIIIVTWNRPEKLLRCLKSLSHAHSSNLVDKIKFNIYVLINGEDPKTETALSDLQSVFQFKINVYLSKTRHFPGAARNQLLLYSHNNWKFFLDDDAWLVENYFDVLSQVYQKHIQQSSVRYLAGPNLTFKNSSYFAELTQSVLENPIYAPYVYKRYARSQKNLKVEKATEAKSILCNFWLNQSVLSNLNLIRKLEPHQFFDSRLMGGEESELVHALDANNIEGIFSAELAVWHERRTTWVGFFMQMIKYGEGRGVVIKYHGRYKWFHIVPLVFLAFFLLSLSFGFSVVVAKGYLVYLLIGAIYSVFSIGPQAVPGFILAPIVHIGYALGLIKGLLTKV